MRPPRPIASALVVFACLALAGCGGEPAAAEGSFPAEPYATIPSEHGALRLEIRTGPAQPPERGLVDVEYTALDAASRPVSGLSLSVVPWMPAMGHGIASDHTIEPRGEGRYVVKGIGLFMPGKWELRTSFEGTVNDDATIPLQIP